jgi:hypothetical protein
MEKERKEKMKNSSFPGNEKIDLVKIIERWWDEIDQDEFHPSLEIEVTDPPELKQVKMFRRQIAHDIDMGKPIKDIGSAVIAMANLDTELTRHFVAFSEDNIRRLTELGYTRIGQTKHEFKPDDELYLLIQLHLG